MLVSHILLLLLQVANFNFIFEYEQSTGDAWEKAVVHIKPEGTQGYNVTNAKALSITFSMTDITHLGETVGQWFSGTYYHGSKRQVNFMDSTSNKMRFAAVQLEVGSDATPFEQRSYEEELALCQRYYQQIGPASSSRYILFGAGNGTGRIRGIHQFVTEMRAEPIVLHDTSSESPSFYSYSGSPPSYTSVNSMTATTKSMAWDFNTGTHNQAGHPFDVKGSGAFITISAEL